MFRILIGLLCFSCVLVQGAVAEEGRRHVLAVVPVMLDEGSVIKHPQRNEVLDVLRFHSQYRDGYIIQKLKEGGRFFDVRPVPSDPTTLFGTMVAGSQLQGKGSAETRVYNFNPAGVKEVSAQVVAERILVMILHGESQKLKRWDRNKIDYLDTRYNTVLASAYLLDSDGQVLWSYKHKPQTFFLPLQYPNFDDAHYNKSNKVPLVFLKVEGLERHLLEKESTIFNRPSNTPKLFKTWLDEVDVQLTNKLKK